MLDNNGQPPVSLAAFVDCLKQFQEYPERFPLDLRAKFCECSEYSKQPSDDNLKELAHIAEELKDILQQRLTSQSRRARNQRTETNIIETIEYLVTHPERIPLVAVQKLRQVMDNLSLPQSTSRKVFRKRQRLSVKQSTIRCSTSKGIRIRQVRRTRSMTKGVHIDHRRGNEGTYRLNQRINRSR